MTFVELPNLSWLITEELTVFLSDDCDLCPDFKGVKSASILMSVHSL